MKVVILGASKKPQRYSNIAMNRLMGNGHTVIPVHPTLKSIDTVEVKNSISQITEQIDTLTIYIGPRHIEREIPNIIGLKPKRVILNPGTESPVLIQALKDNNIPYIEGCTLVMLSTGQF